MRFMQNTQFQTGAMRKVTRRDLANAISGTAWWLHNTLGPGKDLPVLGYIGPSNLRYLALVLGAVEAGWMV